MKVYLHYGWKSMRVKRDGKVEQVKDIDRVKFVEGFKPRDRVYSIMGGGVEKLLTALALKEVQVRVVQSNLMPKGGDVLKFLEGFPAREFRLFRPDKLWQLKLKHFSRAYLTIQKTRIAYSNQALQRGLDLDLLQMTVPEFAGEGYKDWVDFFQPEAEKIEEKEKLLKREMEKLLKGTDLWEEIFKPIIGVGPVIAASVIGETGDIGDFPTVAKWWSYSGKGIDPKTGKVQRRKKGEASGWNEYLRLALWKFSDSINKQPPEKSKYKRIFLERKEYEAEKHDRTCDNAKCSRKGHIHNRARRYIEKRFLRDIWIEWMLLEGREADIPEVFLRKKGIAV